jgi:hypothetical protein
MTFLHPAFIAKTGSWAAMTFLHPAFIAKTGTGRHLLAKKIPGRLSGDLNF